MTSTIGKKWKKGGDSRHPLLLNITDISQDLRLADILGVWNDIWYYIFLANLFSFDSSVLLDPMSPMNSIDRSGAI